MLPAGKLKLELTERGYIKTNDRYETNAPGVYAAGDIIGPPWLAHVARWKAIQAVEGMFGEIKPRKVREYPGCTYCQPQVRQHWPYGKSGSGIGPEIPDREVSFQRERDRRAPSASSN